MSKVLIEQIINSYLIRYEKMVPMIMDSLKEYKNADDVNIYIDMYSIVKSLYSSDYEMKEYSTLASCIINTCAHYREFFRNAKVNTRFYIVYSKNCPYINNQFYQKYNFKAQSNFNADKSIDDMIQFNVDLLELLCKYLHDIFFIKGTFETGVIMYDLILRNEKERKRIPHIILTKDIYNYQLVSTNDNIIIFRPKKTEKGDESYYINRYNLMNRYLVDRDTKQQNSTLMPQIMSLIMTLSSVKERGIKMLCNITTAMSIIQKAIDNYKILNGYNSDLNTIWNGIENERLKISENEFSNRFKAIDIPYQHQIYYTTPECKNVEQNLVNLSDPKTMKAINAQYFIHNQLDFDRL